MAFENGFIKPGGASVPNNPPLGSALACWELCCVWELCNRLNNAFPGFPFR